MTKLSHRRGAILLKAALFLSCWLVTNATLAQASTAKFEELAKVLREELKQTKTPGAAIAIISGDRVIFAQGEVIKRDGKLYLKQEGEEFALTRIAPYRLAYGSALENELVFVADAGGKIKYLFDGLYSARKVS